MHAVQVPDVEAHPLLPTDVDAYPALQVHATHVVPPEHQLPARHGQAARAVHENEASTKSTYETRQRRGAGSYRLAAAQPLARRRIATTVLESTTTSTTVAAARMSRKRAWLRRVAPQEAGATSRRIVTN